MAQKETHYNIVDAMIDSTTEAFGVGVQATNILIGSTVKEVWNGVGKYLVQRETSKVLKSVDIMSRKVANVIFEWKRK